MRKKTLQLRMMIKAAMIVLFMGVIGLTKVSGFPIICPNGQTLYFRIIDATNYRVEVTYPNHHEDDGYWEDYELLPGDVIIPETIEYGGNIYTVTSIGNYAFCQCDSFNGSLSIPNTVTTIGNMAFYECGQWQGGLYGPLIIPNSVLSIGDEAFVRCNKITGSLVVPNSVTHIGNSAFGQCSSIEHVSIPNSVLYIGNGAFRYCTSLDYIDIPNSVEYLGASAFLGCCGLSGSLIIPNSITTINASSFQGCSNLTSVIISNSVTSIEENAFKDCTNLVEIIIPSSVNSIKNNSFVNTGWYNEQDDGILYLEQFCIGYKGNKPEGSLSIIDDIQYVCDEAFKDCTEITMISFPNSLIKIGNHAFSNCSGINGSLTIPDNVTVIGDYAFKDCNGFSGNLTIGNSVISIGNFAFYNCNGFTGPLTISNSVISIGNYAFYNCKMFSGSLKIGNSVSTIGYSAFQNCIGLNDDLIIPNSVTLIDNQAFTFCTGLSGALIIGNSVTTIGGYAFYGCSNLSSVSMLEDSTPTIGSNVFYGSNCQIYVPYESLNVYKTATNWSSYQSRIYPLAYITIPCYGEGSNNWRFIASPLTENFAPTIAENLITETEYDLYQFNQTGENGEWENYKVDNFNLANGHGYLYANTSEVNVIFKGEFNEDATKEICLIYDANAVFEGWNLVGNPFPCHAYINREYYVLNEEGTAINPVAVPASTPIPPCTGVMVKAETEGETVVFTKAVR